MSMLQDRGAWLCLDSVWYTSGGLVCVSGWSGVLVRQLSLEDRAETRVYKAVEGSGAFLLAAYFSFQEGTLVDATLSVPRMGWRAMICPHLSACTSLLAHVWQTPQSWPMRTRTQALMCFQTFPITPHLSRSYPGVFREKSESKLNWNNGWYKSRRSATRPPSFRPLCRTPPSPDHPPPVRTAGAARHADCGNPSSFGLHRVSHRDTWPCPRGLVFLSRGAGVRWWGGTGRPEGVGGRVGTQYMA